MGKFSRNRVIEYNFASLEEMICDIIAEFKDTTFENFGIGLALTDEEVPEFLVALMSTGRFKPEYLEYEKCDYCGEYHISLDNDELWLSKAWSDRYNHYIPIDSDLNNIVFVSKDITEEYLNTINDGKNFIVLFDIEK